MYSNHLASKPMKMKAKQSIEYTAHKNKLQKIKVINSWLTMCSDAAQRCGRDCYVKTIMLHEH